MFSEESRLAIQAWCFTTLTCLLLAQPLLARGSQSQTWDLGTLDSGKEYSTTITAANISCRGKQTFEIKIESADWLRITGPTVLRRISREKQKATEALVDTRGLAPEEYKGRVTISCTTCPPPPKCTQNISDLAVRLVVRDPKGEEALGEKDQGDLTLDKVQGEFKNPTSEPASARGLEIQELSDRNIAATYGSEIGHITLQLQTTEEWAHSKVVDSRGELLSRLSIPLVEGRLAVSNKTGELTFGDGFSRQDLDQRIQSFAILGEATDALQEQMGDEGKDTTLFTLRSHVGMLGLQLEKDGAGLEPEPEIAVFSKGNNCHKACGPGCDWCACFGLICACETNRFCAVHDECCGAWLDFLNCEWDCLVGRGVF